MIFRSFLLGNLVSLYMKRVNLAGLYYGFLTTLSIGPSYLLLCRAQVMEEREEGVETKVSATTGFIMGQFMMVIAIYYTPLHLALGRPYIITVLAPLYILFHFFWNNHKNFVDSESSTKNVHSMRNLSIQCIFISNIVFKFLNFSILPSSMLARLVNIYMFRCNNKMLFVTTSFWGWLIGHIFLMKWIEFVLVWIRKNYSSRSSKYVMVELRKSMARISSILFFITCIYYLDRIPSPLLSKKPKESSKSVEKTALEMEKTSELTRIQKEKQELSLEEDSTLFSEQREGPDKIDKRQKIRFNGTQKVKLKEKLDFKFKLICYKNNRISETFDLKGDQEILKFKKRMKNQEEKLWPEQPLVTLLFDYKRWNRPLRYIKNDRFENALRNEMSQYFFDTCQSGGKLKISFASLTSLVTFFKMLQRKKVLSIYKIYLQKFSSNELYTHWFDTNEQKKDKKTNEVINKIEVLYKAPSFMMIQRIRFWNNETKRKYWLKIYDPFLSGPYRGTAKKSTLPSKAPIKNLIEPAWINKIHGILFSAYREFEQKLDKTPEKKSLTIGHLLTLMSEFAKESAWNFNFQGQVFSLEQGKVDSKYQENLFQFVFDNVMTDAKNKKTIIIESIEVKIISKQVSQWSYKLIDEMEQKDGENDEDMMSEDHEIRLRKAKDVVIFSEKERNTYTNLDGATDTDEADEVTLIRYSQQSDFRRAIIKGSVRAQRRKTGIEELFQTNIHSPLFWGKKNIFFSRAISEWMKFIFRNRILEKNEKLKIFYNEGKPKEIEPNEEDKDKRDEKARLAIAEAWDTILFAQALRGCMLVTQSNFRKYIRLPSLIIIKNIGRIFLFKVPEWSEDFKEWKKEMHVKCTYHGVQLSETEFPKNWLMEGIQIKILFPFHLKSSKPGLFQKDPKKRKKESFFFLTVWGMKAKLPFGSPLNGSSFFDSNLKKLMYNIIKLKKRSLRTLRVLKERLKIFLRVSKETTKLVLKNLFLNKRILPSRENRFQLLGSHEPKYVNCTKYSLTEKKIQNFSEKINKIRSKKKKNLTTDIKMSPNKKSEGAKKRLESSTHIWKILKKKRRNTLLIGKSIFFFEQIYIKTILCILNISGLNTKFFLKSTKKAIDKSISNKEETKKRIAFCSTITKCLFIINKKKTHIFFVMNLSYLSQRYLFLKISQIKKNNLDRSQSVLQKPKTCFFLKNAIKDYCRIEEIFRSDYKLKENKLLKLEKNHWKNWLRGHYPYEFELSPIRWSRLLPQKWRQKINQHFILQNRDLNKEALYKYKKLIFSKKQTSTYYERTSLPNQNKKLKKRDRYNFLSYKSSNLENRNDSYIYGFPLQAKKSGGVYYKKKKCRFLDLFILENTSIKNYLRDNDIGKTDQNLHKKFCSCPIIQKKKTNFLNWMEMNNKILNRPIGHMELWFFAKFLFLYKGYKIKPWDIPIQFLFFNFFENVREIKSTKTNKKFFGGFEKNQNKEETEYKGQRTLVSDRQSIESLLSNPEIDHYMKSNMKKRRIKKRYKSNTEAELDLFLKRYLFFQLRGNDSLTPKMINNIKINCFLLRLINSKEICLSSIREREMSLDIMTIQKNLTLQELMKQGIFIIEPVRLSIKRDNQRILYQTLRISLVHKSKHQIQKSITSRQKSGITKDENHSTLLVPETILSRRRRREFRILICFNSRNRNHIDRNFIFCSREKRKNWGIVDENKHFDKAKLRQLKFFLWPNYRFEDLTCMNRYWFDINNSSCFSMLKTHMYP